MTRALEFLACELGGVKLDVCPAEQGFTVRLEARGIDRRAAAPQLTAAVDTVAAEALADYRARHRASLAHAESQAEAAREALAAIAEMEDDK